jgi:hypothetical protein
MDNKFLDVMTGFATIAVAKQILDDTPTYGYFRSLYEPAVPPPPKPRGRQRIRTYYKGRDHVRHCNCCDYA